MNYQIIQMKKNSRKPDSKFEYSLLNSPHSLDEYDYNVIDLTNPEIWCFEKNNQLVAENDLLNLKTMIERSKQSKSLIVYPPDLEYTFWRSSLSNCRIRIKNDLKRFQNIMKECILPREPFIPDILFENTKTEISGMHFSSDFYFDTEYYGVGSNVLTKSIKSEKATTFRLKENLCITTMSGLVSSELVLEVALNTFFPPHKIDNSPPWMQSVHFNDDLLQKKTIEDNEIIIQFANQAIEAAREKLEENSHYKSILYTNGDQLVQVVFEILEKILDCDLSEYVDNKREDFLIKKDECTFIGEIKGVTSNIKNEHISQVDVHYQKYLDELNEQGKLENIKQLLIINPCRTKQPSERESVSKDQIKLATRNGCLIITTAALLKMFERFLQGKLSSDKAVDILSSHSGFLYESMVGGNNE